MALSKRPPAGEDDHEPPVGGAGRGQRGQRQPRADGDEQHPPAAEAVGHADDREAAERRQADDGQSDAEVGSRQPGLVGERRAVRHLAEPLGDVAQRGHDAELPEPGGEGGDGRANHGPVGPAMQLEPGCSGLRGRARHVVTVLLSTHCFLLSGLPNGPRVDAGHAEEDSRAPDLHSSIPLAVILVWINLAVRTDIGGLAKVAWAMFSLIPLVPFVYVLTGGDLW